MDKKQRIFSLVIMAIVFLVTPFYCLGAAEPIGSDSLKRMDQLSEQVLSLTDKSDFAGAKQGLDELSSLYTQIGVEKKISIEAMQMISDTLIKAKRNFAAIRPDKNAMVWSANQVRLLTDAITHPNQPMWKDFHPTFGGQIDNLINLANKGDSGAFSNALQNNVNLYDLLKPCFAIHQTPQTIEMMDSIYRFLVKQADIEHPDWGAINNTLVQLHHVSDNVFLGKVQNTFGFYMNNNSPLVMISVMSSILLSVLSYVGWKMYQGKRFGM